VSVESGVGVLLLPQLRVIYAMIVIGRVTQRETKAHVCTGHTKSLQHNLGASMLLQRSENEQNTCVVGPGTKRDNRKVFGYNHGFLPHPFHDNFRVSVIIQVLSFLLEWTLINAGIPECLVEMSRVRDSASCVANEVG